MRLGVGLRGAGETVPEESRSKPPQPHGPHADRTFTAFHGTEEGSPCSRSSVKYSKKMLHFACAAANTRVTRTELKRAGLRQIKQAAQARDDIKVVAGCAGACRSVHLGASISELSKCRGGRSSA